jgi:DNA-binding GntR family transcriptional regulator
VITKQRSVNFSKEQYMYEMLLNQIAHLEIAPGQYIIPSEIAIRCGVNPNTVRKACLRLESKGIVSRTTSQNSEHFQVIQFNKAYIDQIFGVRRALETAAMRSCSGGAESQAKLLYSTWEAYRNASEPSRIDVRSYLLLDEAFHKTLGGWSENKPLSGSINDIVWMSTLIRRWQFSYKELTESSSEISKGIEEHLTILDALLASDGQKAMSLLSQHISEELKATVATAYTPSFM